MKKLKTFLLGSKDNKKILVSFLLVPVTILFILGVGVLLYPIRINEMEQYPNPEELTQTFQPSFTLSVMTAPILEEHIFRMPVLIPYLVFFKGRAQTKFKRRLQIIGQILTFVVAVISILAFAQIHVYNAGVYLLKTIFLHTVLFGGILTLLAIRTKSLLYPMLTHSLNNSLFWYFA